MEKGYLAIPADRIIPEEHKHVSKNTGNVTYEQYLVTDEDTGMLVKYIRYPKGTVTPIHDHHCAHGMYVLKGTLHTDKGDFGPGSFIWFEEGNVMTHGATQDEDVDCLFITIRRLISIILIWIKNERKKGRKRVLFYLSFTALYARPAAFAKNPCALEKARGQTGKEYPNASKDPLPCHMGASRAGPAQ